MSKIRITRTYKFEMSHALFLRDEHEVSKTIFGRDVNPHGHNWRLDITVEGKKDVRSHMIYDLNDLDSLVRREIDMRWDHKHFDITNLDQVPTLENITQIMFNSLREKDIFIKNITLYEEPDIYASYSGGEKMYVTHIFKFNAQHRTHNPDIGPGLNDQYYGKCNRFHGHSYELSVTMKGKPAAGSGLLFNHKNFKDTISNLVNEQLDHKVLNDLPGLEKGNATTENLLEALWPKVVHVLKDKGLLLKGFIDLYRLRIKETDRNIFDYFGPDNEDIL